mmetsp:Transcript_30274/g.85562  ORF Transcript_30274/g.85562 Transcript_30274/m.85562 type:complete len:690 (-) Transcript_30274:1615-3684(-)
MRKKGSGTFNVSDPVEDATEASRAVAGSPEIQPQAASRGAPLAPRPSKGKNLGFVKLGKNMSLATGVALSISMLVGVVVLCFLFVQRDVQVRTVKTRPTSDVFAAAYEFPSGFQAVEVKPGGRQQAQLATDGRAAPVVAGALMEELSGRDAPEAGGGGKGRGKEGEMEQQQAVAAQGEQEADAEDAAEAPVAAGSQRLPISLAPLNMEHANDTIDIQPEDYRVPDVSYCGKLLRAEPDVRVPTYVEATRCTCRDKCDSLDFPAISYILNGYKSGDDLTKAMKLVYMQHSEQFPGQPLETIVRSSGISLSDYSNALKAVKPKVKDLKQLMLDSFLLMRSGQPEAEHVPGMVRMANAPRIMVVSPRTAKEGTLPQVHDRGSYLQRDALCENELDIALVIQYFKRPNILQQLLKRLRALPGKMEIMINNDSASELKVFLTKLAGVRHTVMVSGDIHEIRGYNRLGKLAHAKLVAVLQDDDLPPNRPQWLYHAASAFTNNHRLGFIGGFTGTIQGGPQTDKYGVGRSAINTKAENGLPFMFVTLTNIGPFIMRQDLFWHTGMFNMNFSCRGDPGIGFDYEYSLRTWWKGYQVGLFNPEFVYHWGNWQASGTRANRPLYKRRQKIEKRNSVYHKTMYGPQSARAHYFRQGLPGRSNAKKTARGDLKGVGVQVHDANDALEKNPSLGGSLRRLER